MQEHIYRAWILSGQIIIFHLDFPEIAGVPYFPSSTILWRPKKPVWGRYHFHQILPLRKFSVSFPCLLKILQSYLVRIGRWTPEKRHPKRRCFGGPPNTDPHWMFPKIVISQNGWFIMESPIKMDDLGVPPFMETPIFGRLGFVFKKPSCHIQRDYPKARRRSN